MADGVENAIDEVGELLLTALRAQVTVVHYSFHFFPQYFSTSGRTTPANPCLILSMRIVTGYTIIGWSVGGLGYIIKSSS